MGDYPTDKQIQDAYALARERYAMLGVDTEEAVVWLPRGTIPAKPVTPTNCAAIWIWPIA
jgi:hypothetical protein